MVYDRQRLLHRVGTLYGSDTVPAEDGTAAMPWEYGEGNYAVRCGLPIEYGTVQVASVLGGLFFYQEAEPMLPQPWRLPTIFAGLFIILVGVALSSQKQFPWESKR